MLAIHSSYFWLPGFQLVIIWNWMVSSFALTSWLTYRITLCTIVKANSKDKRVQSESRNFNLHSKVNGIGNELKSNFPFASLARDLNLPPATGAWISAFDLRAPLLNFCIASVTIQASCCSRYQSFVFAMTSLWASCSLQPSANRFPHECAGKGIIEKRR